MKPTPRPAEVTDLHTMLLKCTLEIENSRSYWQWAHRSSALTAERAFEEFVFGDRSLRRLKELLPQLRTRFDAYPPALSVLHEWTSLPPETRRLVCHWHVQLSDPLYRRFSSDYLLERRASGRTVVSRDQVVQWIRQQIGDRWSASTRINYASKLLSAVHSAGLVLSNRDPRPLGFPPVPDEGLEYLLYLLRGIDFEGTLLDNPYLASVGLERRLLDDRLRSLPNLTYKRQSDLVDLQWRYTDLRAWATHTIVAERELQAVGYGGER